MPTSPRAPGGAPRPVAEEKVNAAIDRAVSLGLLAEAGDSIAATKRWKDALVGASVAIARQAAECPTCPRSPDPIGDCVRRALITLRIGSSGNEAADADMIAVLSHFELASMPAEKRAQNGYREAWP
ncbi:MAG: hypothetical protein ACYDDF_13000 [Thermoplasmatota archaeon]